MFHCVDCHTDVKSLAHDTPPQKSPAPSATPTRRPAYAHSIHAKATQAGKTPAATCQDCHGDAHAIVVRRRSQFARQPRQHSRHLRPLPRAKVPHGVERRKRAALPLLSGQRARPRRRQRLAKGRGLHRLPRRRTRFSPPTIPSRRSHKFNVAGHLRQMPHRRRQHLHASIHGQAHRARQHARARLH